MQGSHDMKPIVQGVLFDLDGTLLDTAADLGNALNQLLREEGLPKQPMAAIRLFAGTGCRGLLKLGMNISETDPRYPTYCDRLLGLYENTMLDETRLFQGMTETLAFLEQKQIHWGIVTNKPQRYTIPITQHLGLDRQARCIVSGDTLPFRKPHPAPLLHACQLLASPPQNTLYVGDMHSDVKASRLAGLSPITALYGYIPSGENPETWQADAWLNHPTDLMDLLEESMTPA